MNTFIKCLIELSLHLVWNTKQKCKNKLLKNYIAISSLERERVWIFHLFIHWSVSWRFWLHNSFTYLKNPLLYIEIVCILTNIQGKLLVTVDRMCSLSIFVCEFSTCLSSFQCFSRKTTWFHACYFRRPKDVFSLYWPHFT